MDVELSRRRQIAELFVDGARGDRSQTWASMHFGSTVDRRSCELVPRGPGDCRGGAVDTIVLASTGTGRITIILLFQWYAA